MAPDEFTKLSENEMNNIKDDNYLWWWKWCESESDSYSEDEHALNEIDIEDVENEDEFDENFDNIIFSYPLFKNGEIMGVESCIVVMNF